MFPSAAPAQACVCDLHGEFPLQFTCAPFLYCICLISAAPGQVLVDLLSAKQVSPLLLSVCPRVEFHALSASPALTLSYINRAPGASLYHRFTVRLEVLLSLLPRLSIPSSSRLFL